MRNKLLICFIVLTTFLGCTRDDICDSETSPTTPLLVVEFRDITDRVSAKQVNNLRIILNTADSTQVVSAVTDTIVSVPLNTEINTSEFLFVLNSTSEEDRNFDKVTFVYDRQEEYINRACAFRLTYNNLFVDTDDSPNDGTWILDTDILNNVIENSNEAHITVYH